MGKRYRDEEVLREMYVDKGMTTHEIADELDCSQSTVRNWMEIRSIPTRSNSEAQIQRQDDTGYRDPDTLERLYHDEKMTMAEIGEKFGVSQSAITGAFQEHDIETRSTIESREIRDTLTGPEKDGPHTDPEWLREKYIDEELTLEEVADEAGNVTSGTILRQMDKHGIERRTSGLSKSGESYETAEHDGHPQISFQMDGSTYYFDVHRLLAIAIWGIDEVCGSVVHHKNGIGWDNRPDNLELIDSQAEHAKLHCEERERDEFGRFT